jgi:5S rRNA maturation endonuclease (ribonuclease M5)
VATYDYVDASGVLQFQQVRHEPKGFSIRSRDASGAWHPGMNGGRRVLYRLPELLSSNVARTVWVCEGEKDVETLARLGHLATCNPLGAGKWKAVADLARTVLSGRCVRVIADRDDVGRQHARDVATSLRGAASSVVVLECTRGKDITDHLANGGTLDVGAIDGLLPMSDQSAAPRVEAPRVELDVPDDDAREPEVIGDESFPPPSEPTPLQGPSPQPKPTPALSAQPASTAGWDVWTPDRIYAPLPLIEWAIDGIAPKGSLGMFAAYGASLKSWLALDLLDAMAVGRPWLGRFPCRTGPTFLVDFEAGDYETRRRLQAIARGRPDMNVDTDTGAPDVSFVTMPDVNLTDPRLIERLEPIAAKAALIVMDTLAAGSPGLDQNDPRFAESLYRLKALANRSGCVILVIHHNRKSSKPGRDGSAEDERELIRGSSAIFNALDWCLGLTRKNAEKSAGEFLCAVLKARNGKAVSPFTVRVEDVGPNACRVVTNDSPAESTKLTEDEKAADKDIKAHKGRVRDAARLVAIIMQKPGIGKKALYASAEISKERVDKALDLLEPCTFIPTAANRKTPHHLDGSLIPDEILSALPPEKRAGAMAMEPPQPEVTSEPVEGMAS